MKKSKLIYVSVLFVFLFLLRQIFLLQDISTHIPFQNAEKTWLITYGTGSAYEAGQNFLSKHASGWGFEANINYKPRDIEAQFYQKNKKILDQKHGVGYWLWKPYIIDRTLAMMQEGEYLFYCDAGYMMLKHTSEYLDMLKNAKADMLLVESGHMNRVYCKKDAFVVMNVDEKHRNDPQFAAGFIVIKNTQHSREFIKKWLHYSQNEQLLTDVKSSNPEFEDFLDHRHDQAILSLLYYKFPNKIMIRDSRGNVAIHQRRSENSSLEWLFLKEKMRSAIKKLLNFKSSE